MRKDLIEALTDLLARHSSSVDDNVNNGALVHHAIQI